jgi:hypothetical protein
MASVLKAVRLEMSYKDDGKERNTGRVFEEEGALSDILGHEFRI